MSRLKPAIRGVQFKFIRFRGWTEVTLLIVDWKFRGRGIGSSAVRWLKKEGRTIRLTVIPEIGNKTALHRFYRRLGFRAVGKDPAGYTEFEWLPKSGGAA